MFKIHPSFAVQIYHVFFFRVAVFVGLKTVIVKVMKLNFGNGAPEQRGQMNIACFFAYGKGVLKIGRKQRVRIVTFAVGRGEPAYKAIARVGFHFDGNACIVGQVVDIQVSFVGNARACELARTVTFYSRTDGERIVESCINGSVVGYGELINIFVGNKRGGFAFAVVPADEFEVNGFSACRNLNPGTLCHHKLQLFFGGRIALCVIVENVSVFARDNG